MEYVINQSGNRVVLDLLANATKSLVGLAVNNCRIISIPYSELYAMVLSVYGVKGEWVLGKLLNTVRRHSLMPKTTLSSC